MDKKINPDKQLKQDCEEIVGRLVRWHIIKDYGCQDPFYADGCNMNLVRNHIIYYKKRIMALCQSQSWDLPEEYYLPTPPVVSENYMANFSNQPRVRRLTEKGDKLIKQEIEFDEEQQLLC